MGGTEITGIAVEIGAAAAVAAGRAVEGEGEGALERAGRKARHAAWPTESSVVAYCVPNCGSYAGLPSRLPCAWRSPCLIPYSDDAMYGVLLFPLLLPPVPNGEGLRCNILGAW